MRAHRFVLAILALCSIAAGLDGWVRAGTITLTVATNGKTFKFTGSGTFSPDIAALNKDLTAAGSAYQFTFLLAESIEKPTIGSLDIGGLVSLGNAGKDGALTLTAMQSGYQQPMGKSGLLTELVKAGFRAGANPTDSLFGTGIYNGTTSLGAGPLLGNVTGKTQRNSSSATISPLVSPYSLTESVTITLSKPNVLLGYEGIVSITPEPSALVLLATGMLTLAVPRALVRIRERGHRHGPR